MFKKREPIATRRQTIYSVKTDWEAIIGAIVIGAMVVGFLTL